MPENKTRPTDASVAAYVASCANAQQATDSEALMQLFERLTGEPPVMWGPSIARRIPLAARASGPRGTGPGASRASLFPDACGNLWDLAGHTRPDRP